MLPNRGHKCFFTIKRRCFWVECLYIGSTEASHSPAIVWNVTLDRLGVPSTILYLEGSLRVVAALASVRASAAAGMPPTPSTCPPHQ